MMLCRLTLIFLFLSGAQALSAEKAASPDETAIRAAITSYVEAYNRGDAKAVAEHWAETAEWVNPAGDRVQGRAAIQAQMAELFEQQAGGKIEVLDMKVRLISADVAIEEGVARVTKPAEAPAVSNYLAIHVKKGGQWKLDSIRETEARGASEATDNLKQLEWMVGEWIDESPDVVVEHQCHWSDDKHFLLSEFLVQIGQRPAMKGTVRIGWDPQRRQIRSWTFDSEGGFSEGFWTQVGERWVVKVSGVRPDGSSASATNVYTPVRRDRFVFSSVDRLMGDEQEPDLSVVIVRKPPKVE
jgi:uncharacterized protein (TIGR02246 family)